MTKPVNRRNRRGRKRCTKVEREPNGRRQRDHAAARDDAQSVVVAQRVKAYGVTPDMARSPNMGSAVGRLLEAGQLTPNEKSALHDYQRVRAAHHRVWDIPAEAVRSIPLDPDSRAFRGGADDRDEIDGPKAKSDYAKMMQAINAAHMHAAIAVGDVAWRDQEPRGGMNAFWCGVTALRLHFRYPDDRRR